MKRPHQDGASQGNAEPVDFSPIFDDDMYIGRTADHGLDTFYAIGGTPLERFRGLGITNIYGYYAKEVDAYELAELTQQQGIAAQESRIFRDDLDFYPHHESYTAYWAICRKITRDRLAAGVLAAGQCPDVISPMVGEARRLLRTHQVPGQESPVLLPQVITASVLQELRGPFGTGNPLQQLTDRLPA